MNVEDLSQWVTSWFKHRDDYAALEAAEKLELATKYKNLDDRLNLLKDQIKAYCMPLVQAMVISSPPVISDEEDHELVFSEIEIEPRGLVFVWCAPSGSNWPECQRKLVSWEELSNFERRLNES